MKRVWLLSGLTVGIVAIGVGVLTQARVGWSVMVAGLVGLGFFATSRLNVQVAGWVARTSGGLAVAQVLLGFLLRLLMVSLAFAVATSVGLSALALGVSLIASTLVWLAALIVAGLRQRPPNSVT